MAPVEVLYSVDGERFKPKKGCSLPYGISTKEYDRKIRSITPVGNTEATFRSPEENKTLLKIGKLNISLDGATPKERLEVTFPPGGSEIEYGNTQMKNGITMTSVYPVGVGGKEKLVEIKVRAWD